MEDNFSENSFEKKFIDKIQKQYIQTNTMLLLIHVMLSIPYLLLSPKHMLRVNCFSILFYIVGYSFLQKSRKMIYIYSYMILFEILFHDICCVLIFGWQCGFQLWIISLANTYIKDYITPEKPVAEKKSYTNFIITLAFFTFVALFLITKYVPLPFQDPPSNMAATIFLIMNAFITFSALSVFNIIYTQQMEYKYTELHRQADYDQLTGLGNRYYMNDLLAAEERNSNSVAGYSVAMMDIDFFKKVNDTYGHNNGDVVLRDIAKILSTYLPENFNAARWGGEEFLVISNHNVNYEEFQAVMERVREKIASHIYVLENNQQIHCTVSIGAASYQEGCSVQEIIRKADHNLYAAKAAGRNRMVA